MYWEIPGSWFPDIGVEIEIDPATASGAEPGQAREAEGPPVARRDVAPPLRRWAAARLVVNDPSRWGSLLARAYALDRRGGAAVMSGLLDAVEHLAAPAQDVLIAKAVVGSDHAVRRSGLELVATRHGIQAACDLAKHDPNTRIRSWAESLVGSELEGTVDAGESTSRRAASTAAQPTLL